MSGYVIRDLYGAFNADTGRLVAFYDMNGKEQSLTVGSGTGDLLSANNLDDLENVATARANLGLAIGTNVQAYSANLASIGGVTSAADKLLYATGTNAWSVTSFTSTGRSLVGGADAAAMRGTLGLAAGATAALATQSEATAGSENTKYMTPLRTAQAIAALGGGGGGGGGGTWGSITGTLASQTDLQAALDAKADAKAAASITGANTLTQAAHFNRHVSWTGSSTAAQSASATASAGDIIEVSNDGSAILTFTGITVAPGYRLNAYPGETFQAIYSNSAWVSLMRTRELVQNIQSAAYTLVDADANTHILHPSSDTTARIWTIPANSSVAFPIGTREAFVNQNGAGTLTIAITSDTMRLAGTGSTGSRTLAANGIAVALKITATEWLISGTNLT